MSGDAVLIRESNRGKLLSYHYLTKKELVKRLDEFYNLN